MSIIDMLVKEYNQRKVCRTNLGNGLEVSTAWTDDEGFETAVIDGGNDRYISPVERYPDRDSALRGHLVWCRELMPGDVVTMLGGFGGLIDSREITLIGVRALPPGDAP